MLPTVTTLIVSQAQSLRISLWKDLSRRPYLPPTLFPLVSLPLPLSPLKKVLMLSSRLQSHSPSLSLWMLLIQVNNQTLRLLLLLTINQWWWMQVNVYMLVLSCLLSSTMPSILSNSRLPITLVSIMMEDVMDITTGFTI
jgi:hypothetical protein